MELNFTHPAGAAREESLSSGIHTGRIMTTTEDTLGRALKFHRSGDLHQADLLYQQVLQHDPHNADALHLRGLVLQQRGEHDAAIECIRQAVRLHPHSTIYLSNLAAAYHAAARYEEAAGCCRRALQIDPTHLGAHRNFALALIAQAGPQDIIVNYQRTLERTKPDMAQVLNRLGIFYEAQGQLNDAEACYRRAIQIDSDLVAGYVNLGNVLVQQDSMEEAFTHLSHGLQLDPYCAEGHNNMGVAQRRQGYAHDAAASFRRALEIDPNYARAHFNLGKTLLLLGNTEEGWREYAWRWRTSEFERRHAAIPVWDGNAPVDRTILLYSEQGLGDTVQFIRYASLVKRAGATVVLECPERLVPLLKTCPGINQFIPRGQDLPPCDAQAPLMSLPAIMGTSLDGIPADVPYLSADAQLQHHWQAVLQDIEGFKIGIGWQGSLTYASDQLRSFPLSHFAPLAAIPGVRLISLQKGPGAEKLADCSFPVTDFGRQLDEAGGVFMDTAALMTNLDLVITSDSALAHLAGALGIPVWCALPYVPDWRWMLDRADSPWYPTMRMFRQTSKKDWDDVFAGIADAVRGIVGTSETPGSPVAASLQAAARDNAATTVPAASDTGRPGRDSREAALPLQTPLLTSRFNRLKAGRHGYMLYNRNDVYIGRSLEAYGEFSEAEIMLLRHIVRAEDTVIEAGSNVGAHTLPLARQVGPNGRVYAFEPQRIVFQTLCANMALNGLANVDCRHAAVGREPGEIIVPVLDCHHAHNFGGMALGDHREGERVPVVTLDSLQLDRCRLIKIDVEGMEKAVLQGAEDTLTRCRPIVYAENDRDEKSPALIDFLMKQGYRLYWHLPPLFAPDNYYRNMENIFGRLVSINMLGIPEDLDLPVSGLRPIEGPHSHYQVGQ
jgi:FkbM family methyltransferase